ncbi:MAG: ABC transporter ATP-binding protein [Candidatus Hodarchaeota archaeon]
MYDNIAIKTEGVSKKYCKSLRRSMLYGVKDIARNTFGLSSHSNKLRKNEFWAIDNVSFEVEKGETLGIIGPNGSGKTTLLKMLNGIFWPDKGKISIRGRVGALIEVGAGFHPMLLGRENIYINGAILGMSKKEIDDKYNDIVEFADIGDFINSPVKFYSSGMFVRLGFAVAAHCDTDILLVDEILAVGDAAFRRKCSEHMKEFMGLNKSVVLVSHNMALIEALADKTILLNKGKVLASGTTKDVIAKYDLLMRSQTDMPEYTLQLANDKEEGLKLVKKYDGYATDEITIEKVFLESEDGEWGDEFHSGENVALAITYKNNSGKMIKDSYLWITFINEDGINCMGTRLQFGQKGTSRVLPKSGTIRIYFHPFQLTTSTYKISIIFLDYTTTIPYSQGHYGYVKAISDIPTQKPGVNTPVCWPLCEWKIDSLEKG